MKKQNEIWYWVLGGLLAVLLFRYFGAYILRFFGNLLGTTGAVVDTEAKVRKMGFESGVKEAEAKNTQGVVVSVDALNLDANAIYVAFGLDKPGWNPVGWVEDEEAVLAVLATHTKETFPHLDAAYSLKFNRSLKDDLRRYLSSSELKDVSNLWL